MIDMADFLGNIMKQVSGDKSVKPGQFNQQKVQQPVANKEDSPEQIDEFIEKLNNLSRSVRTLEERYTNLRRRTQLTDHNILVQHQKLNKELRINDSDLIDIKRDLQKLNEKIGLLERELTSCAKKQKLDILAKYIGYWKPLQFVTRSEAEKIIQAAIVSNITETEKGKVDVKKKKKHGERSIY